MSEKIPQTTIAKALALAQKTSDRVAAEEFGMGVSTLRRYRAKINAVSPLAAEIQSYVNQPAAKDWLDRIPGALDGAISFLERANLELDPTSYRAVDSIVRAINTLHEAKLTAKVIEQRFLSQ